MGCLQLANEEINPRGQGHDDENDKTDVNQHERQAGILTLKMKKSAPKDSGRSPYDNNRLALRGQAQMGDSLIESLGGVIARAEDPIDTERVVFGSADHERGKRRDSNPGQHRDESGCRQPCLFGSFRRIHRFDKNSYRISSTLFRCLFRAVLLPHS